MTGSGNGKSMKESARMKFVRILVVSMWCVSIAAVAAPPKVVEQVPLTADGERLFADYEAQRRSLQAEIARALPAVDSQKTNALQKAREALNKAQAEADVAANELGKVKTAEALVGHAKGKWIGGADKGIAAAEAALKKAATDAERTAAEKDLAHWRSNRADGVKALNERQSALDKAKVDAPRLQQAQQAAQAALGVARSNETRAVQALLADLDAFLAGDRLDGKLVRCVVLTEATPRALAAFAQQAQEKQALVAKLLADEALMKVMLHAGGSAGCRYAEAFELFTAIQKASSKAREGLFQRLALATALEFAVPVAQANAAAETNAPAFVDPVKRYLHYEKAYLDGELDPAFKDFTVWEYRMVVECDAPDAILAWGREMLRSYRPDHVYNPDYGWRYSAAVRTEVPYGSQNVKDDRPELHSYQNIPLNGGVCGRRAFFGRFILRAFGIPVWGVTQHKHAALSHWTPKGWVVNLGAGFNASWWDKDNAPRSGMEFLLESQAREHARDYWKVLRAQWASTALGEPAVNERRKIAGGLWSNVGRYQAALLAANAVTQGPLGQELGEANEAPDKAFVGQTPVDAAGQQVATRPDGTIVVPAALHGKHTGPRAEMKSFSGGTQIHVGGGFKTQYAFDAPREGAYRLTVRLATLQAGQQMQVAVNGAAKPLPLPVPYTVGLWQQNQPVDVTLVRGRNTLDLELLAGSRGVTIKELQFAPVR
jgi:hypothetical protein